MTAINMTAKENATMTDKMIKVKKGITRLDNNGNDISEPLTNGNENVATVTSVHDKSMVGTADERKVRRGLAFLDDDGNDIHESPKCGNTDTLTTIAEKNKVAENKENIRVNENHQYHTDFSDPSTSNYNDIINQKQNAEILYVQSESHAFGPEKLSAQNASFWHGRSPQHIWFEGIQASFLTSNYIGDPKDCTQEMAASWVKANVRILTRNGEIFIWTGAYYDRPRKKAAISVIKACFPEYIRNAKAAGFWAGVLMQIETSIETSVERIPQNLKMYEVAFVDGVYDIIRGTMRESVPEDGFRVCINYNFDPFAGCSGKNTDTFVNWAMAGQEDRIKFFWENMGRILSQTSCEKKMTVLYSDKQTTGKGTVCALLKKIVGPKFCVSCPLTNLSENFHLALLSGKKLLIDPEAKKKEIKDPSMIKLLTGGGNDTIEAPEKYGPFVEVETAEIKLLQASNYPLRINSDAMSSESEAAFWGRVMIIPFEPTIPVRVNNPNLVDVLYSEADYFIWKSLSAYADVLRRGYYTYEKRSVELNVEWSKGAPSLQNFGNCYCDFGLKFAVCNDDLYDAYVEFCANCNSIPDSHQGFISMLKLTFGLRDTRIMVNGVKKRATAGVRLKNQPKYVLGHMIGEKQNI